MSDRQRFTPSSQRQPCPVCGRTKDGDCRISEDSRFVLCHSEINSRQPREEFNGFVWLGEDSTGNWGKWIAKSEDWRKIRPTGQEFRYTFCDRQGNQLVQEVRVYQPGDGKKQRMEPKGVDTSKLVPYRYAEAHKALQEGAEYCFFVEGPPLADWLWDLGLPAVTFANGFQARRDGYWFEGYETQLIAAADQDKPGITKAEKILRAYPMARLLKPWPDSCWWEPEWLPEKNGKDVKDWIEQLQAQGLSSVEIRDRILEAVELSQPKPEKPDSPVVEKICNFESTDDTETGEELAELTSLSQIQRPELLPKKILTPLQNLANRLSLPVEAYVMAVLAAASSQINVAQRLEIDPATNFYAPAILWIGMVGDTGTKKSPLLRAIVSPLDSLQAEAEILYQCRLEDYEGAMECWRSSPPNERGRKPKPPVPREFYLSDYTLEALSSVLGAQSNSGLLVSIDELARFFTSMDAYRGGKGGDRQHWLSLYDGGALKINRKGAGRVYAPKTSVSLLGGIQPDVIRKIWQDDPTAEDGLWSRFAWVRLPFSVAPGIQEGPTYDLSGLLRGLYETLAEMPATTYRLSSEAIRVWNDWHHEIETLILQEPSPILRATYPKTRERAARIALVTHLIHTAMAGVDQEPIISAETLRTAIQFTRWLQGQTRLLYAELGVADNPETVKILKFVNRFRGCGWLKARMVKDWWPSRDKPTHDTARQFMARVVSLGYAIGNGKDEADFRIQISTIGSPCSPSDPKPFDSNGFGRDYRVVPNVVPVVPLNGDLNNKRDDGDYQRDYPVVPTEDPSQQLFQETGTTGTTNLENQQTDWIPTQEIVFSEPDELGREYY
jgi:hypothetical protein